MLLVAFLEVFYVLKANHSQTLLSGFSQGISKVILPASPGCAKLHLVL